MSVTATSLEEYVAVGVRGAFSAVTVVPVANEVTCADLLRIAGMLTTVDGRIIALVVHTSEAQSESDDQTQAISDEVAAVTAADPRVELHVQTASTVARGVLDTARDRYADLILLGVTRRTDNTDGPLGRIARDIVTAAGCDVMLLRPSEEPIGYVSAGSGSHAAQLAETLAGRLAVGVTTSSPGQGLLSILHLAPVQEEPEHEGSLLHVVEAAPPGNHGWQPGIAATSALSGDGAVLIIARHPEASAASRILRRVVPRLTVGEHQRLIATTAGTAKVSFDYVLLCIVSALLASFGLLTNSAAVVIGAMLVAPLLGPLSAFGVGLATGDLPKMRLAARTTLVGTGVVFGCAYLLGLVTTAAEPTGELAARGAPTLLDGGVALASGVVGAYATARKDIPAALAGVAIAAALVPPVCAAAIGFAHGHGVLAVGATLLFVTNIVCIAAIAAITFELLGVTGPQGRRRTVQRVATVVAVIAVCAAVWVDGRVTQGIDESQVRDVLSQALGAEATIVSLTISGGGDPVVTAVAVTAGGATIDPDAAEAALQAGVGREMELRLATLVSGS